jgi:beta-galactosidase
VVLRDDKGGLVDKVSSYAGIRTVGKKVDKNGNLRFTLNGQFIFHWGVLDQGWWPDGGLTPPSEEAMRADVDYLKAAGFNTIRKHMKVENRRFYEYCDKVGMMVWQDFPAAPGCADDHTPCNDVTRKVSSTFNYELGGVPNFTAQEEPAWPEAAHGQFMAEMEEMVDALRHYPSIVVWTPFNENWGQHRTLDVGRWLKAYDSSRLLNIASGGNFWPVGDIADYHEYPNPFFPVGDARFREFVKVAGEFGGHALPVKDHMWDTPPWFYAQSAASDVTNLKERYAYSLMKLSKLHSEGLAAGIYTQTTDVETELNGLMTYDRVAKMDTRFLRHALKLAGLMNFTLCHDEPDASHEDFVPS